MQDIDEPTRAAIARVSNLISILAAHFIPLSDKLLIEAYDWAVEQDCGIKDFLQEDVAEALVVAVTARN